MGLYFWVWMDSLGLVRMVVDGVGSSSGSWQRKRNLGGGGFGNDGDFGGLLVQRFRGWAVQQFYKKLKKNKRKEKLTKKPNHPSYLLEVWYNIFDNFLCMGQVFIHD